MNKKKINVGIIGGSGLDDPKILKDFKDLEIETPFGKPSSPITTGKLGGVEVAILSRHGRDHSIMPSKVPYRANVWALKEIGCTHLIVTTACGSLREDFRPGDVIFLDQFIDNTKHRPLTFFEDKVIHTTLADPFCAELRQVLSKAAAELNLPFHNHGTMITIEGPRFSTRAESKMFQQWGADVVNMSTVPEVILARELGLPYQSIAMVTDYDCWRKNEAPVTWEMVMMMMRANSENVKKLLMAAITKINFTSCDCTVTADEVKTN